MAETPRYRVENGESIVDIRLASIENVFDNRDPAPFRERDLDPQLASYLIGAAEDLATRERFRVVFWLDKLCSSGDIEVPYRAYFQFEIEKLERSRRRQRRAGWVTLVLAIISITVVVALSQLVARVIAGSIGAGLKEGLVVSGWVLMWRPIEVLVYDSIPWRRSRRVLRSLLAMPIEVRARTEANMSLWAGAVP